MNLSDRVLIWLPTALVVAFLMELWAALLHGKVWHASLWFVHRSHHVARIGRFERNDALSVLHAPIAIVLVLYGCAGTPGFTRELAYGIGIGMTLFGVAYAIVHDGLVHGRLPVRFLLRSRYFKAVVRAHRTHHVGTRGGPPFGLFLGPLELARHRSVTRTPRAAPARRRAPTAPPSKDQGRARPFPRPRGAAEPSSGETS